MLLVDAASSVTDLELLATAAPTSCVLDICCLFRMSGSLEKKSSKLVSTGSGVFELPAQLFTRAT